eukprot:g34623.t1
MFCPKSWPDLDDVLPKELARTSLKATNINLVEKMDKKPCFVLQNVAPLRYSTGRAFKCKVAVHFQKKKKPFLKPRGFLDFCILDHRSLGGTRAAADAWDVIQKFSSTQLRIS